MYKARLVAKGFRKQYGVDLDEMFSLVMKMNTLWFLLGVVTTKDLELIQLNVKTAFPHGDVEEVIYVEQPKGFVVTSQEHQFVDSGRVFMA